MRRREFLGVLGGAATAWPLAASAQQQVRRVGVFIAYAEDDPETKSRLAAFRLGLAKRGWSEGRNVRLDYRFAGASADQYQSLAKELIAMRPDVVLAHTTFIAAALKRESPDTPVVFVNVSNPIEAGLVASLPRPGGNVTGVIHFEPSIVGKWLGMLKEISPGLTRIAFVANPRSSAMDFFMRAGSAALPPGIELMASPVDNSSADIERVLQGLARVPTTGIVTPPDSTSIAHRDLIIALTARHRLPAVYPFTFFVAAGGLMSYGTDQADMFRLAASYVDRILRGDKPADLPVQAPTRFETAINLGTARSLGLGIPPGLLVAADEIVE